jgi:addiction module HigA family antidote
LNGKAGVSVDMAIRLSKAFGSSAETSLGLQTAYDLAEARERHQSALVQARVTDIPWSC